MRRGRIDGAGRATRASELMNNYNDELRRPQRYGSTSKQQRQAAWVVVVVVVSSGVYTAVASSDRERLAVG